MAQSFRVGMSVHWAEFYADLGMCQEDGNICSKQDQLSVLKEAATNLMIFVT